MSDVSELLRQCEIEIGNANYELSRLIESEEEIDPDEFQKTLNILMEEINHLQNEYAKLLESL
jgi:hypothetical protein